MRPQLIAFLLLGCLPLLGQVESRNEAIEKFASASPPYTLKTVADSYRALNTVCSDRRFSRLGFTFPQARKWLEKYREISKDENLNRLMKQAGYDELTVESLLALANDRRINGRCSSENGKKIEALFNQLVEGENEG